MHEIMIKPKLTREDANTMKVGQFATITFQHDTHVIVRCFEIIIDLTDPENTWSVSHEKFPIFEDFKIISIDTEITIKPGI